MKDLSLHILDIVQNSIVANASLVEIDFSVDTEAKVISIEVKDNGKGMSSELLAVVTDPYTTSRTTRKVGMGIPLLKQNAEQSGGLLMIESELGVGTTVKATFMADNIDTPPVGDLPGVISLLMSGNPTVNFTFRYRHGNRVYIADTREIKEILGGISISEPQISSFLKDMIKDNVAEINQ